MIPIIGFQPFLQLEEYTQERAQLLADLFFAAIILACWLASFLALAIGRSRAYPRLATLGAIALGLMTIATPLVPYISGTVQQGGIFQAGVVDFALIAVFGFLGGIVCSMGYNKVRVKDQRGEAS